MAKWFNASVLDDGIGSIDSDAATVLHLISTYVAGDNFTLVTSTNSLGSVALAGGDKTLQNGAASARELVIAAKTITGATASGASPDLHLAIVNGTIVLAVTDETSDQEITGGNDVNVPTFKLTMNQPT